MKEIVNLHSGNISVETKIDHGTKFVVKIPKGNAHFTPEMLNTDNGDSTSGQYRQPDRRTFDMELAPTENPSLNEVLLIVEDNHDVRNYLIQLLSPYFEVVAASNGQEGYDLACEIIPDLVISDVMMPVMDGVNLTLNLKKDMRTSHIPVVLLTARTSLIYRKEGFEVGADAYITKPFNEVLLITQIRALMQIRQQLRQKFETEHMIQPKELSLPTRDQKFFEDLLKIIENNLDESELKADYLARELAMSHSVIYKKIKALTGLTLVEFIRDFRLKRAAQLLVDFQFSVTDACFKVGFNDRRYFSQMFKKKFGKTPSDYVREHVDVS